MIVPDASVRAALEQDLGVPVVRMRRTPCSYATSHRMEHIALGLADGRRLRIVFKDLSPAAVLEAARGIRPELLQDPRREIEVYRSLLTGRDTGAPALVGAISNVRAGRHWLFLERVSGRPLWECGRFSAWLDAARALARLHARRAPGPTAARSARLLTCDRAFYRVWMERAMAFRPSRRLEQIASAHARAVEALLGMPRTFIHGECFASNLLVAGAAEARRICPIDWESAALGPGLLDLAALVAGWAPAPREALLGAYAAELEQPPGKLVHGLACARLHLAIQMLGWSPKWRAPRAHRRNWLAEAGRAAGDGGW